MNHHRTPHAMGTLPPTLTFCFFLSASIPAHSYLLLNIQVRIPQHWDKGGSSCAHHHRAACANPLLHHRILTATPHSSFHLPRLKYKTSIIVGRRESGFKSQAVRLHPHKKLGLAACASNPSPGVEETGRSQGLRAHHSRQLGHNPVSKNNLERDLERHLLSTSGLL